jgi:hypothetical protein
VCAEVRLSKHARTHAPSVVLHVFSRREVKVLEHGKIFWIAKEHVSLEQILVKRVLVRSDSRVQQRPPPCSDVNVVPNEVERRAASPDRTHRTTCSGLISCVAC